MRYRIVSRCLGFAAALCAAGSAIAQTDSSQAEPAQQAIVFASGTGSDAEMPAAISANQPVFAAPPTKRQPPLACSKFSAARERLIRSYPYPVMPLASRDLEHGFASEDSNPKRLDRTLLEVALASYDRHNCLKTNGQGFGPSQIVVVDFAKPSSEPRLYVVDLTTGLGLDTPVAVAHGIGSDRDDDGIADQFSNVYMSLASSLGAARGAELYHGANGLSLRLDGLDHTNSQMRIRDIVAHSYQPERRRYFNASLLSARGGKPGTSEGCFVVAPHLRDWLFDALRDGGFLFAGLGGQRAKEMPAPPLPVESTVGEVQFVSGTGVAP